MANSYGGQALIEGVMMRGKKTQANVVRLDSGRIVSEVEPITSVMEKYPILKKPFIRGTVSLIESLFVGMKALTWSTNVSVAGEEDEEIHPALMALTVLISLAFGIALFFFLPVGIAHLAKPFISGTLGQNILEGLVRVLIFLAYLWGISRMKEIHRVFQYHGAEHKAIHCYESGLELTPENAQQFTTLHPRCGTSFLFLVMVISIFVFALAGVDNLPIRLLSRLLLLPVVAGISYEILKFTGKNMDSRFARIVSWPGMQLQHLTTAEPDLDMLEVAIYALQKVRAAEENPEFDPERKVALLPT